MILAIIQARMSSKRLPGKVLKPVMGRPLLSLQIERIKKSKLIDKIVIATSSSAEDQHLEKFCQENKIICFRGPLDNVLERFYLCAKKFNPNHIIRLTGDCPLIHSNFINDIIKFHQQGNYDYSSNSLEPTLPDGLDIEIMSFSTLQQTYKHATLPSELEHVTPFIYNHPKQFRIGYLTYPRNYSNLRWTVDEPEDFEVIKNIFENLYNKNNNFGFDEILNFFENHPNLQKKNQSFARNEGYFKSLERDKKIME